MIQLLDWVLELVTIEEGGLYDKVEELKNSILAQHTIPITQGTGKDKRWMTRVPDETAAGGYRMIRKASRKDVEKEVIAYYLRQQEQETPAVKDKAKDAVKKSGGSSAAGKKTNVRKTSSAKPEKPANVSHAVTAKPGKQANARETSAVKPERQAKVPLDITVGDFFWHWYEFKQKNPKLQAETFRKYRNDYKRVFKDSEFAQMPMREIDATDIESFLAEVTEEYGLKRTAVSNIAGYIRGMCRLAVRDRLVERGENPYLLVDLHDSVYPLCVPDEKNTEERILTTEEVQSLRKVLKERHKGHATYMPDWAIEICLWTGLRVGEVVALSWDDIQGGQLSITKSERRISHDDRPDEYVIGDTKNHMDRKIPIGKELQKVFFEIRQVCHEAGFESEYIIADDRGRLPAHHVSNAMYRRGKEAGAKACSIHAIRRTVSSQLNRVYDKATVSHIMGHTEEVNTNHYDYDTEALDKKCRAMDNLYAG